MKKWQIAGTPHGVAVAANGIVYLGLAEKQSVLAIDPAAGKILRELVLDSAEIASTKELVTLRLNAANDRLIVANGSDESVSILQVPALGVVREITLEGEAIRDAIPDPAGRYLYILGSSVHIFDAKGERELRNLSDLEPMAIASNAAGTLLAVVGSEDFGGGRATMVALYDTTSWKEVAREPLQTDRVIQSALFAANDRALVVLARDWLGEKTLVARPARTMAASEGGVMRMRIGFGDLVSGEQICLPDASGPQVATLGTSSSIVVFAEKRCSSGAAFTASRRIVESASLYGVTAWSLALHAKSNTIYASDPSGYLTMYKTPQPGAQP